MSDETSAPPTPSNVVSGQPASALRSYAQLTPEERAHFDAFIDEMSSSIIPAIVSDAEERQRLALRSRQEPLSNQR